MCLEFQNSFSLVVFLSIPYSLKGLNQWGELRRIEEEYQIILDFISLSVLIGKF